MDSIFSISKKQDSQFMSKKKRTEYTQSEFADLIGVHESTVWRWVTHDPARLKMYDAEVVEFMGRKIIRVMK